MTVILAIDTSTTAVTAAVLRSASGTLLGGAAGAGEAEAERAQAGRAAAVQVDVGHAEVVVRSVLDARAHTELVAPLVRDVLAEAGTTPAGVTAVAVGCGPGPFTGLRVG
ncbi:MAG: hypothetical protein ACRCSN_19945, partial [Dermatophilaceae bacterium]